MADESTDKEDRTEEATPQRREQAREKGHVPRSRDLVSALTLMVGTMVLLLMGREVAWALFRVSHDVLGNLHQRADMLHVAGPGLRGLVLVLSPFFFITMSMTIVGMLVQTGVPHADWLSIDLARLNPLPRLGQLFSPGMSGWDLLKTALKIGGISLFAWQVLGPLWQELGDRPFLRPAALLARMLDVSGTLLWRLGALTLLIALMDYVVVRLRVERELRMSKQEIREELRQNEGNPQVKRTLRRRARDLLRRRIVVEVPKSDVVVVNPTHFAVALSYKAEKMRAPRVTAKGVDNMAQRIRELARGAGVPVVQSPALARELHRRVRVGREVPGDLYKAVAEVLAFVYRIRGRGARAARKGGSVA